MAGEQVGGDKVGGDKVGGDKIAGNKLTINDGQGMQVNSPQAPVIQVQGSATFNFGDATIPSQSSCPSEIAVQPYLQSIATTYAKWWQYYTLTDAEGQQRQQQESAPLFDFGLMVQTVRKPQQERQQDGKPDQEKEKVERFSVLEGLRKYALGEKPEPVLLVGRPGSGKSTALARLMLEEASLTPDPSPNLGRGEPKRIPVLVELRYWQGSIAQLILDAFNRHQLAVSNEQLEAVLVQALLLFDGVNELPSEEARSQLMEFRRSHPNLPMIFTTRDLSLGAIWALSASWRCNR